MGFKRIESGIYSYYKNSDKDKKHQCYYISVTALDGKTRKVKSKYSDIRNVRKERAGYSPNDEKQRQIEPTLNELTELYLSPKKKSWSKENKQKFLYTFGDNLGKKKASQITDKDIANFIQSKTNQGLQPRADLIRLKALLTFGGSTLKISVPPANSKKKRYFTEDELSIIFDMANRINNQLYVFMQTLLYTGQRPKNLLDLKINDVDFEHNQISFQEIKGQEADEIPLSNKLKPILQEFLANRQYGSVFTYGYDYLQELAQEIFDVFNKKLYYVDGMSKQEEKEARKEAYKTKRHKWASFYALRHTTAVNIIKNTQNVFLAKEILRHSDIKTTMIYAQLTNGAKEEAVNAI